MGRFILKHIDNRKPQVRPSTFEVSKNNKINEEVMTTSEKVALAQDVLNNALTATKRIKKDKGLIERSESSKTVLTEDNKELLID